MEALFLKFVNMSITASWLVLAVIAVRLLFRKVPKWILCLLWGLVAVRLICPFTVESKFSLIPDAAPVVQEAVAPSETSYPARGDILDSQGNIVYEQHPPAARGEILDADGNVILEKVNGIALAPDPEPEFTWTALLAKLWVAGVFAMFAYTAISYLMLKRKVAAAVPFRPGIRQSEYVDSPFVLGIIRPVIYLPFGIEPEDMHYVIAHEEAHIRRADHWWKPMGFLLLSVYWFNPVLWVAYVLLCRDIEAACDEKVIRNMDKDQRRAYSTALLHCSIHRRRIAACPLAFGEIGVKTRIQRVMHYRKPAFWLILIALVVSIAVAVCFLTDPERASPVTMRADFVSRTQADLIFIFEEDLDDREVQIGEEYILEVLEKGKWRTVESISEGHASEPVYEIQSEDGEFDAWSLTDWEEQYGRLPDGTFRIRKEISVENGIGEPKSYPVSVEFTIGGTADDYVIYSLEDVTPTGAKLYEQETGDADLIYDDGAGIWLEVYQEEQWQYLEPTRYIEPVLRKDRHYITQLIHPSDYTELDWSALYGALPDGTYRIAREITGVEETDLRVCTAYAEFTVGRVYTWFDSYSDDLEERHPKSTQNDLPGANGISLVYDTSAEEIRMITDEDEITVFSSEQRIRSVLLTDLNGDGVSEICANLNTKAGRLAQIYDPVEEKRYDLPAGDDWYYILTDKADRLCALKYDRNLDVTEFGQVFLSSHGLEIREVDEALKALTDNVVCVDIWTRRNVSFSSGEEFHRILTLLHGLAGQVQPVDREELEAIQKDDFNNSRVTVQYALGEKVLVFSEDFGIVWESDAEVGFRIDDPEPLRQFVENATNGVRDHPVSGEVFASADTPWAWSAGISMDAVESARMYICLDRYRFGNTSGSTTTNGWISQDTLQDLIQVLNRIPRDAYIPDKTVAEKSYRTLFTNLQEGAGSVSVIDGVNNMAALINYRKGNVTMLLTDEMEKARDDFGPYLEPTQLWEIKDEALAAFMESLVANPPVIIYSVGAEYKWQDPIEFNVDGFSLELRLPEGWEYVHINNPSGTGIRCRPEGVTDGWIYFSYKPEGYSPMEEDRYYGEGSIWGYPIVTSYPSSVKSKLGIDTRHAVWSFQRVELGRGAYVIINDGADEWFQEYEGQIEDIITLSDFSANE